MQSATRTRVARVLESGATSEGTATVTWSSTVAASGVAPSGATSGYRTINAPAGDRLYLNMGNMASGVSVPETWALAGRLLSTSIDGEIISLPTWDPLDFFFIGGGTPRFGFWDGVVNAIDGPAMSSTITDFIVVFRRPAGSVARWSLATNTGSGWSATTHTNDSAAVMAPRPYPASGLFEVGWTDPSSRLHARFAAMARANAALSDAQVESLTTGLNAWAAITAFTNFWEFGPTVIDHRGTASLSSVTGTTTSATGFPLAPLSAPALPHQGSAAVTYSSGVVAVGVKPSGGSRQGSAAVTYSSTVAASGLSGIAADYLYDNFPGSSLDSTPMGGLRPDR